MSENYYSSTVLYFKVICQTTTSTVHCTVLYFKVTLDTSSTVHSTIYCLLVQSNTEVLYRFRLLIFLYLVDIFEIQGVLKVNEIESFEARLGSSNTRKSLRIQFLLKTGKVV